MLLVPGAGVAASWVRVEALDRLAGEGHDAAVQLEVDAGDVHGRSAWGAWEVRSECAIGPLRWRGWE